MRIAAGVWVAAAWFSVCQARAEVSGTIADLSDDRYRGASISDGNPAVQASIAVDHPAGPYAGALLSNVKIGPDTSGPGLLLYGGLTHRLIGTTAWDVGVLMHRYPSPHESPRYDYAEWYAGIGDASTSARLFHASDYYGVGLSSWYLEANHSMPLDGRYRLSAHLGYLVVGGSYYGIEGSRLDYKAAVGVDVAGAMVELSLVGTNREPQRCPAEKGHCGTTVELSVSRRF